MLDVTIGPVVSIIDGNTFTMLVTHIGSHNAFTYKNHETIRIANQPSASISTQQGLLDKIKLMTKLNGKKVRCKIHHRDQYNVLIADIEITA